MQKKITGNFENSLLNDIQKKKLDDQRFVIYCKGWREE